MDNNSIGQEMEPGSISNADNLSDKENTSKNFIEQMQMLKLLKVFII